MGYYNYYAITKDGYTYTHYKRENVLEYYDFNKCVELGRKTKDLFPKVEIIIDRPNADVRNINDEDIMNRTTVAMRKAIDKYDKAHTKQLHLKLNTSTDADILEALNGKNVNGYIKELIRKDISERNVKK